MSMTPEERRARNAEAMRRYREANREKDLERQRRYREANKENVAKWKRKYDESNKENVAERKRRYHESNKEKIAEQKRRYQETNKEKIAEQKRRYREANKENVADKKRRKSRRKCFTREDGSSFQSWLAGLYNRSAVFEAIANLQPDPGQTLAELIHELSGYAMEVCEQIANPPVIEEPQPTQPEPQPDLF